MTSGKVSRAPVKNSARLVLVDKAISCGMDV